MFYSNKHMYLVAFPCIIWEKHINIPLLYEINIRHFDGVRVNYEWLRGINYGVSLNHLPPPKEIDSNSLQIINKDAACGTFDGNLAYFIGNRFFALTVIKRYFKPISLKDISFENYKYLLSASKTLRSLLKIHYA